jgi:hypothetical protein
MKSKGAEVGMSRTVAAVGLLAAVFAVLPAACGGSSGGGGVVTGPESKFLGKWSLDTLQTTFSIACSAGGAQLNFWSELDFERGVLTDVSETGSTCLPPGLAFDLDSSNASISAANPDPYTGAASLCSISLGSDAMGFTIYLDLTISSMDFTLLPASTGKAPTGVLSITANGAILQDDGTGMGHYVQADSCTYSGTNDTYHRMTQP